MAAQLPLLARADVQFTYADGRQGDAWQAVQVLVRRNRIELADAGGTLLADDSVVAAQKTGRNTWRVRTAAGAFTITRQGGCGCRQ